MRRWKREYFCPGDGDETNGMAVVARLLADDRGFPKDAFIVHGAWLPSVWWHSLLHSSFFILHSSFLRMPHGAYDPVRLGYHGWKKRLVGPLERWTLRRAKAVLATCEAEKRWILAYEPKAKVEVIDLKKYFGNRPELGRGIRSRSTEEFHILFLGRRHPLKGVGYLERAVEILSNKVRPVLTNSGIDESTNRRIELRVVSDARGEEKERVWEWCDLLVLPTLSENFGLVVAEALERGKRVIVTDGAPAWGSGDEMKNVECRMKNEGENLIYLKGFLAADDAGRVEMLAKAISDQRDLGRRLCDSL